MEFYRDWMEFFFIVLMIIGLTMALMAPSAVISYILVFLSGLFAGRIIFRRKHNIVFPFLVIIIGFLIGYMIGIRYGNRAVIALLYMAGAVISYNAFNKGMIGDAGY